MEILLVVFTLAVIAYSTGLMGGRVDAESVAAVMGAAEHLVIDVRTPGEFAGGHLPAAVNVPLHHLDQMATAIGDKGRPVLVYCRSGARSSRAAKGLAARGFTQVVNGGGLGALAKHLGVQPVR